MEDEIGEHSDKEGEDTVLFSEWYLTVLSGIGHDMWENIEEQSDEEEDIEPEEDFEEIPKKLPKMIPKKTMFTNPEFL